MNRTSRWLVPALILVIGLGLTAYLASQDRAVKVTDRGVPVAPPVVAPAPAPGQPVQVPGGVIRSLDNINAAAARVGCPVLVPNDPAGKLLDVGDCMADKLMEMKKKQK